MRGATVGVLGILVVIVGGAAQAANEDVAKHARARVLFDEGMKQYNLGRFTDSLLAFQEAYLNKGDPVFLYNIGQCDRQLGHSKEAAYSYRRYLSESPNAPNRAEVERFIAAAEEEIKRKEAAVPPTSIISPHEAQDHAPPIVAAPAPAVIAPPVAIAAPPVAIAANPPAAPEAATPVYKKWWLWTLVAAVVVVGGVGIGIAYGVPNNAPSSTGGMAVHF